MTVCVVLEIVESGGARDFALRYSTRRVSAVHSAAKAER